MKYYDATNGTLLKALVASFQNKTRFETALKQMDEQADGSWDTLAVKLQRSLSNNMKVVDDATELAKAAQAALKDERHWTIVDVVDRAEAGNGLAEMILAALEEEEASCPEGCKDCRRVDEDTGQAEFDEAAKANG